jgi:hypothetical protein
MATRKTKPAAKKAAAKKKPAARRRQPEPEVQVNRQPTPTEETPPVTTTETRPDNADPGEQVDDNSETQDDRDAAGEARRAQVMTRKGPVDMDEYEPHHEPLENADFDHHGAEERRQAELAAEREEHNRRTGDASR